MLPSPLMRGDGTPVLDAAGRLRVYFSPRDERGRSHIGQIDVDLGGTSAPRIHPDALLAPGALGAFDDDGVNASCALSHAGRIYLYYTGWHLGARVPFAAFIGCAVSDDDGRSFRRVSPAPIVERDRIDPFLTGSPWVRIEGGIWRMWYLSGTGWTDEVSGPRHRYHIKYAESRDGLAWSREGAVCIDYRDLDEYAIARPCVIRDPDRYRMWFSHRGDAYRIGYAESMDGIRWDRQDDAGGLEPSQTGWDSKMVCYGVVLDVAGRRHMLYNGNRYGLTGIGDAVAVEEA